VFLVFHHPPYSELWYDVINFDGGPNYVVNTLFPIIKKYTKVQQIHYGHTHGLERGTITSEKTGGDFRIICGGGSGGPLDPWTDGVVHDYPDIHKTYSEYFFQLVEVDVAKHQYQNTVYSLGNLKHPKPLSVLDFWYKKTKQPRPATPAIEMVTQTANQIKLQLSPFSGADSLMSVQVRIYDEHDDQPVIDTTYHWQNIFGIDANGYPVDENSGLNMLQPIIPVKSLTGTRNIYIIIRYRDHNLRWSDWSDKYNFKAMGLIEKSRIELDQNYPNPFNEFTYITYILPKPNRVRFQVINPTNQLIAAIDKGFQAAGEHTIHFDGQFLPAGTYLYQLISKDEILTKEMIKY
jgi:hypothetical protein